MRDYRDKALNQKEKFATSHSRAADIYASLFAAVNLYIDFAFESKAINEIRTDDVTTTIDETLKDAIRAQSQYQKQADEVERFIALLRACFGAGECHVGNHLDQGPPVQKGFLWGWRKPSQDADMVAGCGQLIGWLNETNGELWLQPEAAFKVAQRFAMAQNDPLLMQKATLWKRLLERGLLADFDTDKHGRKRTDVKRTVAGGRPRVLVFPTSIIESEWGADDD